MARIIGIDYGERRMGVAVCDEAGLIAMPFAVVRVQNDKEAVEQVARICREVGAERCVVGMPYSLSGVKGASALKVEAFIELLKPTIGVPVESWDERFTTTIADRSLQEASFSEKKRRTIRDKVAAQILLQSYLDRASAPGSPDEPHCEEHEHEQV